MRLTHLMGKNFQGGTFAHSLSPLTIITGDNFEGKTRLINAIRVLLMGYDPRLGKTNPATFQFSSGASMSVAGAFDNGRNLSRTWNMKNGSVKAEIDGEELNLPALLFDAREFFKKTSDEQLQYIFDRVDLNELGFTPEAIYAALKNVRVEEHDADAETVLGELLDEVEAFACECERKKEPVQVLTGKLIAAFKERKAAADASVKRMNASVIAGTELTATGIFQPRPNLESLLAAARDNKTRLVSDRSALTQKRIDLQAKIERKAAIERILNLSKQDSDTSERIKTDIAAIERELPKIELAPIAGLPEIEKEIEELTAICEGQSETGELSAQRTAAANEVTRMTNERDNLIYKRDELKRKIEEVAALKKCPFCKCSGKGWRDGVVAEYTEEKATLEKQEEELSAALSAKKIEADRLGDKMVQSRAADNKRAEAKGQRAKLVADREIRKSTRANEIATLRDQLATHRADLARLEKRQNEIAGVKIELDLLGDPAAQLPAISAQEKELSDALVDEITAIGELEAEQRRAIAAKNDAFRAEQASQAANRTKREAQVFKASVEALTTLQAELIKKGVGNLLAKANQFTSGILKTGLEYRDGDFGRFEGSTFVTYKLFSGYEESLSYAALQVVLNDGAPIRIVMMDELGRIRSNRKQDFIRRMNELVAAGLVDQFIGVDPNAEEYVRAGIEGLQIVNVGA